MNNNNKCITDYDQINDLLSVFDNRKQQYMVGHVNNQHILDHFNNEIEIDRLDSITINSGRIEVDSSTFVP